MILKDRPVIYGVPGGKPLSYQQIIYRFNEKLPIYIKCFGISKQVTYHKIPIDNALFRDVCVFCLGIEYFGSVKVERGNLNV